MPENRINMTPLWSSLWQMIGVGSTQVVGRTGQELSEENFSKEEDGSMGHHVQPREKQTY